MKKWLQVPSGLKIFQVDFVYNSLHRNCFLNDMKYELNEVMYYLEFIVKLVENGINELDFVKRFT